LLELKGMLSAPSSSSLVMLIITQRPHSGLHARAELITGKQGAQKLNGKCKAGVSIPVQLLRCSPSLRRNGPSTDQLNGSS